ncbi:tumor necrosis factor ligand superfamily member 8 [Cricetulus griseus]|uniref:Tumor necrosis factor ligand superfamily member 8 n=1 Tax=Cricetulus griseus TaxID=10029 RepID=A0A061IJ83_CRIGR|nr:tumor necrosis factor ligand superfamily member 8 [Cricetulus griseus]XP_027256066.1 tumor necrosis factor ligand superfamily member 8 [Cricetulus griseus]ERE84527.1 tumor necrosis factor ligand superfamily member 8-like protein [Cricetulus griseus]
MEPGLQQTSSHGAPFPDPDMQIPPDSVASPWRSTRPWRTTSHSYFYLSTTALVCLVVAMAIILVLVVQKKDSTPRTTDKVPLKGGNCSEDLLCTLKRTPFKKSWAYLRVSKHLNNTKLSWNQDGIIHGVGYQDGNLVVQFPGWYFIICQLQFFVQCSNHSVDLSLRLLVNSKVKKQALVTVCESGIQTKNIYQNLSQFLLYYLQVNSTISVMVDNFQYVDTNTFPLQNVLSIFLYSSSN